MANAEQAKESETVAMRRVRWFASELAAWKPPEKLTVSAWADRYRILDPLTSAEPGPWRTDRTPYLKGILDSFSDASVEQITIMASTQVAKTEAQLNCLGYALDQTPGPCLFVLPREEDAVLMGQRRIKPMLTATPSLRAQMSDWASDNKLKSIRVGQSMIYLAGANSPADLASKPVRFLFLDEVDKFPAFSGKEADPISLATERQRTFWNRKRIITSTPTTREGFIWREWEASDQHRFWVPCTRCGFFQVLKFFPNLRWPKDVRDPYLIKREDLAWYECENCKAQLKDTDKHRMTQSGVWCPQGLTVDLDGKVRGKARKTHLRGYHLSCLYSPWISFSEMAAKFLESKDDPAQHLNFTNSWLGNPWEEKGENVTPEYLKTRQAPHAKGECPKDALVLTAGVDVQDIHLYYTIRAWGYEERSWLVEAGRVEHWENLSSLLFQREFPIIESGGKTLRVRLACLDSGYRTDEVYQVCREWIDVARPIKGQQRISGGIPIRMSKIDRNFAGATISSGVKLWHLDTTHFKDKLTRLIRTDSESPGSWRTHFETPDEYLNHIASEHKVIRTNKNSGEVKSVWVKKPGFGGNHWLDTEVYALAAAEMLGVYTLQEGDLDDLESDDPRLTESQTEGFRSPTQHQPSGPRRGGWVHGGHDRGRRGGWVK